MTRWAEGQNGNGSDGARPVRRPLGQLALEAGLITKEQLASAIADIQVSRKKLGDVLVARGLLDESQLAKLFELRNGDDPVPRLGGRVEEQEDEPPAGARPAARG